jgi:uncharacterized membrane protein
MMRGMVSTDANRPSNERGAMKVSTVLLMGVVLIGVFLAVKISPVYIEQRQITHEVDELARKAAVRSTEKDKINKEIIELEKKFSLKEGSINLVAAERGKVQIGVNYTVPIDLWVTTYMWKHEYIAFGKEF